MGPSSRVVWVSPGGRFELLQVLVTEAVMSWQIYQSPGVALDTREGTLKHVHGEGGVRKEEADLPAHSSLYMEHCCQ